MAINSPTSYELPAVAAAVLEAACPFARFTTFGVLRTVRVGDGFGARPRTRNAVVEDEAVVAAALLLFLLLFCHEDTSKPEVT